MKDEIELKLLVNSDFVSFFIARMNDFNSLAQQQVLLTNCYYDTPELIFANAKSGLRVRKENEGYTMTLKMKGSADAGLHIRPEYNYPLPTAKPDLSLLTVLSQLNLKQPIDAIQFSLIPIFSTDFMRKTWLVELSDDIHIEIALDLGTIKAEGKQQAIHEIEFELKRGSTTDLLDFIDQLALIDGARLSSLSKAQRGYQLYMGYENREETNWLYEWKRLLDSQHLISNPLEKVLNLFSFEQKITESIFTTSINSTYSASKSSAVEYHILIQLYAHYVQQHDLFQAVLLYQQKKHQQGSYHYLNKPILALQQSNQELVNAMRSIHASENSDHTHIVQMFNQLFESKHYIYRMMNFIRLILAFKSFR